jgi:crystallin alpha B
MKESQLAPIKNAFEVKVNVSEYSPAELSVRTVGNTILVEGKHTEREDELGFVSRSFSRRFVIPEDVKAENVTCKLTSDGFLVLSAPVVVVPPVTNERTVPIILSNAPAVVPTTLDPVPQEKEGEVKPSVPEKENPVLIENIGDEDTKGSAEEGAKPA